jgi:hypothetical protein
MDLIKIFNSIRDIPYRIPLSPDEEDNCCNGKHKKLFSLLKKAGHQARYRVCTFLWSSLNLPPELMKISHDDQAIHVYVELFLNNQWLVLDATWDIGLKKFFPINEWDARSNTEIAVKPIETFSLEKSAEIMNNQDKNYIHLESNDHKFSQAFNDWLNKIRQNLV